MVHIWAFLLIDTAAASSDASLYVLMATRGTKYVGLSGNGGRCRRWGHHREVSRARLRVVLELFKTLLGAKHIKDLLDGHA